MYFCRFGESLHLPVGSNLCYVRILSTIEAGLLCHLSRVLFLTSLLRYLKTCIVGKAIS